MECWGRPDGIASPPETHSASDPHSPTDPPSRTVCFSELQWTHSLRILVESTPICYSTCARYWTRHSGGPGCTFSYLWFSPPFLALRLPFIVTGWVPVCARCNRHTRALLRVLWLCLQNRLLAVMSVLQNVPTGFEPLWSPTSTFGRELACW